MKTLPSARCEASLKQTQSSGQQDREHGETFTVTTPTTINHKRLTQNAGKLCLVILSLTKRWSELLG